MLHLTENGYAVSRWSGGTTTQIAIFPPAASYGERDFLWRVSSAVVEDEQSVFTPLPDYDRRLMLLEGSLLLRHNGGAAFRLDPYQPHAFDGGAATESAGRCRDFNLMLRKGLCRGELRPLRFAGAAEEALPLPGICRDFPHGALLLYCAAGEGRASLGGETCPLAEGESLLVQDSPRSHLRLAVSGAADFAAAAIWY